MLWKTDDTEVMTTEGSFMNTEADIQIIAHVSDNLMHTF